ncbi:ROK family transcriptional regulator [Spirillospora sp. CA-255316]
MENSDVRSRNRARFLSALVEADGEPRSTLARRAGLSQASVSRISKELLDEGLIVSSGGQPELLRIAPNAFAACGIALGARGTRVAVVDARGNVIAHVSGATPRNAAPAELAEPIVSTVREATPACGGRVYVTLSVPGVVDSQTSAVSEAPNLPTVESNDLLDALEHEWPGRLTVENDANLAVLGEHLWNEYGPTTTVMLTLSTGIGAGVMRSGQVFRGQDGRVGEIGPAPLGLGSLRIEDVLSGAGLVELARERGLPERSPADILDGAMPGHREIRRLAEHGLRLAAGIAAVTHDPHRLIVGGALSVPLQPEISRLTGHLAERYDASTEVVSTTLGDIAFLAGGLATSLSRGFADLSVSGARIGVSEVRRAVVQLRPLIEPQLRGSSS